MLKVTAEANALQIAQAIVHALHDTNHIALQTDKAESVYQAVKAVVMARDDLAQHGMNLMMTPRIGLPQTGQHTVIVIEVFKVRPTDKSLLSVEEQI